MKAYEYRHVVGFEETNLVGNVYYVNYMRWQGRCRELFLRDHAPEVLAELEAGLALVTTFCACQYIDEIAAFDEVLIRMRLGRLTQNEMTLLFEYVCNTDGIERVIARGEQRIACVRRNGKGPVPVPVPKPLREALRLYADG